MDSCVGKCGRRRGGGDSGARGKHRGDGASGRGGRCRGGKGRGGMGSRGDNGKDRSRGRGRVAFVDSDRGMESGGNSFNGRDMEVDTSGSEDDFDDDVFLMMFYQIFLRLLPKMKKLLQIKLMYHIRAPKYRPKETKEEIGSSKNQRYLCKG